MRNPVSTNIALVMTTCSVLIAAPSLAAELGYYAQPALHGNRIVFVSEGDLWTATIPEASGPNSQAGSDQPIIAHRLTSGDGVESRPAISPDGRWIAFSAEYDGNTDVYVMPIDGGAPKRLTFHPVPDLVAFGSGWLPDGQSVLFASNRRHPFGRLEMYRIAVSEDSGSGMPQRYEFGECSMIAFTATGRRFAFTPYSNENWTWKRYRGGAAPDIWLGDASAGTFVKITSDPANDLFPMWVRDRLYFLSDRTGTMNIFSDSAAEPGKDIKQHTHFAPVKDNPTAIEGYDVRWPSVDAKLRGSRIVFCQAGQLALLDVTDNSIRRLNVQLASDRVAARQRFAPLMETATEFNIAPDGKSVLVGSRGELMLLPVEPSGGAPRQLTRSSNAREWGAAWLNDDQLVAISDQSGEQQIGLLPADGSARLSLLTHDREDWLFPPVASPDGTWIAFADKTLRLHVLNVGTFERRIIDQSEAGEITDYRFSPDSQWLAYTKPMSNAFGAIYIANLRTGKTFPISTGFTDDSEPRWDPAGKYLYFLSERRLDPKMGPLDFEHVLLETTEVFAVPLAADTPPPVKSIAACVGFDLEQWATPPKKDAKPDDGAEAPVEPGVAIDPNALPPDAIRIDTDGLASRQFRLPIKPGNYTGLEALWGAVAYLENPTVGLLDEVWPVPPLGVSRATLHRYDFIAEEAKAIANKIPRYKVNAKADTIVYPISDGDGAEVTGFKVIPASAAGDGDAETIDASSIQLRIDVQAEWAQILDEAWRLQRDFYWAPNYVGVDWPAMKIKYQALLPRIGTRAELNDLVGQMIGELGTSHTYIWGGQEHDGPKSIHVGLLGADIEFDGRGFRIARIIPGQPWGEDEFNSPLEPAYLNVKEGSYITAVNGIALTSGSNIYDLLQDQTGPRKPVWLTITDPDGANPRTIEIQTLQSEQPLRYAAWVETNRRYVEEKSGGALGYLHIPDMGGEGLSMFSRYFYPQFTKQGLVVDIRDNGGGFVSQMIVQRLARKVWAFMQPRHGVRERFPMKALHGHMAVIIDQHAGSDGDIFPQSFRILGLGPLIGTRTWGGVVGIRADKPFVDGGLSTQPEFAWWEPSTSEGGGWSIENEGVAPDMEVPLTPADRAAGRDPQLDAAIEYLMQKLKDEPMELPPPPPWPVRVK